MEIIVKQGRFLLAAAIAALGVENLICAHSGQLVFTSYPPAIPVLPFMPAASPRLIYLIGSALLVAGLGIGVNIKARCAALFLGLLLLVCDFTLMVPKAIARPLDLNIRTCVFEILALCASALTLAGCLSGAQRGSLASRSALERLFDKLIASGRFSFGVASVVFGITHFLILRFIASLVPAWIPGALFWAYLTGAAFVAAGICIVTGWMAHWAAFMLGTMFLLWFLVLHSPRVVAHPRMPAEWSSAFIALGMCGGSWIMAWYSMQRPSLR